MNTSQQILKFAKAARREQLIGESLQNLYRTKAIKDKKKYCRKNKHKNKQLDF